MLFAPDVPTQVGVARTRGYVKEADLPRSAIKAGRVIDRVQWASYRPVSTTS